ncbi:MAG: SLBB domain-containing protein [Bdellovibrionales bacterium]|nr:SLBB domain-containing protein [Oligoflexia bacterium]
MLKNKSFAAFLIFSFVLTTSTPSLARAQTASTTRSTFGLSIADDLKSGSNSYEFVAGKFAGAVMMRVNLWGGVHQPGIYNIPVGTDLVTLLSYAGGPNQNAELSDTRIKRTIGTTEEVIKIDVDDILKGKPVLGLNSGLHVNDIVVVPETRPIVSQNTILLLSVIATVASIAVASVVLAKSR